MNEAFEFQMIIAESFADDPTLYWSLREGEYEIKVYAEWDTEIFGFGIVSEFKPKFAVLDGFDKPCGCHRHDKRMH